MVCCVGLSTTSVNNLLKVITRQRSWWELNPLVTSPRPYHYTTDPLTKIIPRLVTHLATAGTSDSALLTLCTLQMLILLKYYYYGRIGNQTSGSAPRQRGNHLVCPPESATDHKMKQTISSVNIWCTKNKYTCLNRCDRSKTN